MKAELEWVQDEVSDALKRFASYSKKEPAKILEHQAGLLARDVVRVTPPNMGKLAKSRGDAAVRRDLGRAVRATKDPRAEEAAFVHLQARNRRTGRVPIGTRPRPGKNFEAAKIGALAAVGKLVSGWAAAMQKLGRKVPGWIARHGTRRGAIHVRLQWPQMAIAIVNKAEFVGNVRDLDRRIEWALRVRARALDRQVDHWIEKAARRAGFR